MPNFDARIRIDYASIEGLLLDCRHADLADDGSLWTNRAPPKRPTANGTHTGANNSATLVDSAQNWRTDELVGRIAYNVTDGSLGTVTGNTENQVSATLTGGVDNDWDTDDVYKIADPRFGNPYQDVVLERPTVSTVGGFKQADFTRANNEHFKIPLDDDIPAGSWFAAFEYLVKATAGNDQPVLWFPNFSVWRRDAAGNFKYMHGAASVAGVGDMTAGTWLFWWTAAATAELYRNGVTALAGAASAQGIDAADPAGRIGNAPAGPACDIILRTMQVWNRRPSPREVDFAFKTLSPEFEYDQIDHADMGRVAWTDDTGPTAQDISRINPTLYAPHRYIRAQFPTGGQRLVQISASVDGVVLPDAALGAPPNLFDIVCLEYPVGHPAVYQDAGWSSVFDVMIRDEGHYTFAVVRDDGGTVVLHLDAEEV
jgi:hypothetical protein